VKCDGESEGGGGDVVRQTDVAGKFTFVSKPAFHDPSSGPKRNFQPVT
jgi:hypothetical protein